MTRFRVSIVVVAFLVAVIGAPSQRVAAGEVIFDPESGSWFELVRGRTKGMPWEKAQLLASKKTHRGIQGRLAVISTDEKHAFLRRNFNLSNETWIGLRYWCSFRKLLWVDGTVQKHTDFQVWAPRWHRSDIRCSTRHIRWMPVYYTEDWRWQASGPAKFFYSYMVEYPQDRNEQAQ